MFCVPCVSCLVPKVHDATTSVKCVSRGKHSVCQVFSLQCSMFSVLHSVCSVQCSMCHIVFSVQCSVFSFQCSVFSVPYCVLCSVWLVCHIVLWTLLLTSDEVKCTPCIVLTDLSFTTPSRVKKAGLTREFEKLQLYVHMLDMSCAMCNLYKNLHCVHWSQLHNALWLKKGRVNKGI